MRAAWWWIDRWRKSTAYTDMTAEQQGCYRNLLDELWLRDGLLPLSEKALAQISGDHEAWDRCRDVVLAKFKRTKDGYRNATHDEVMAESKRRRAKQKNYRDRQKDGDDGGNDAGNACGNGTGNRRVNVPPSPSPDPDRTPEPSPSPVGAGAGCSSGSGTSQAKVPVRQYPEETAAEQENADAITEGMRALNARMG